MLFGLELPLLLQTLIVAFFHELHDGVIQGETTAQRFLPQHAAMGAIEIAYKTGLRKNKVNVLGGSYRFD